LLIISVIGPGEALQAPQMGSGAEPRKPKHF